jgi:hypothetical protein
MHSRRSRQSLQSSSARSPLEVLALGAVQSIVAVATWDLCRIGRLDSTWAVIAFLALAAPNALAAIGTLAGIRRAPP